MNKALLSAKVFVDLAKSLRATQKSSVTPDELDRMAFLILRRLNESKREEEAVKAS